MKFRIKNKTNHSNTRIRQHIEWPERQNYKSNTPQCRQQRERAQFQDYEWRRSQQNFVVTEYSEA